MPNSPITLKGKAKGQGFVDNLSKESPVKKSNVPAILGIVLVGVAVILFLKSRNNATVSTGPVVSINGGNAPDQSQIDNLTAGVLALQGLVHVPSTSPSGGTGTPITPNPSNGGNGTPGSGTASGKAIV